jgi:hypothetical protein
MVLLYVNESLRINRTFMEFFIRIYSVLIVPLWN